MVWGLYVFEFFKKERGDGFFFFGFFFRFVDDLVMVKSKDLVLVLLWYIVDIK